MASDTENRGPQILAANVAMLVLASLFIALRLAARKMARIPLWWDDWFIILALFAFYGNCGSVLAAYKLGLGRHIDTLVIDSYAFSKATWAYELLYQVSVCLYKLSIVFVYYRVFTLKKFRKVLHVIAVLIVVYAIWSILQTLLQCLPIAANWRIRLGPLPGDHCIPARPHLLSLSITNVILDWTLLFFPMPIIWHLKMSHFRKFELSVVIITGTLVCIFSLIRTVLIVSVKQTDVTWNYVTLMIWSVLEPGMGIICPCLITLRPILRLILGPLYHNDLSDLKKTTTGNTSHTQTSGPDVPLGPFHRIQNSNDESRLAYHAAIKQESPKSTSIPSEGIRVVQDVDVESRVV